eukprot:CAMPEP_0116869298 /NCGR_PEP_ID=MMETSP0418-20121206/27686_1 /TAXON_ID=1158023 /ORGANISM="Astrosyne radiata, Strain 13vi08-1A" /LENGTH=217 /DNA_ID=CAMNT_0004505387 /DNA_START=544 /DNA_END=1197 /DNA_ORIENTATION=+
MVVPSLDPYDQRQPSQWKGGIPLAERKHFVTHNLGIRYDERAAVHQELQSYNGTKSIHFAIPKTQKKTYFDPDSNGDAIFVLCYPGDRAFQKRIFDTWASVAIPVVVSRECKGGGTTHFRLCRAKPIFWRPFYPALINKTYPHIPGVDYTDILVEIPFETVMAKGTMAFLESIPEDRIFRMLQKIESVRHKFVYDLEGRSEDAYSVLLQNIGSMLGK